MSFAAVQKHIAILERAGLVTKERIGRRKVVRTDLEGAAPSPVACLTSTRSSGAGEIDRMTALVEATRRSRSDDRHRRPQGPRPLTMTLDAEFDASPERVWQLWADPRQLERWWGPPAYPATFTKHDLAPGSRVEYHMTTPEGDSRAASGTIVEVDPPRSLVFRDGFANDDGFASNTDLPVRRGASDDRQAGGRTRMSIASIFASTAAMEQVLAMGMEEGLTEAVGQIDAILAEDAVAARRSHSRRPRCPGPRDNDRRRRDDHRHDHRAPRRSPELRPAPSSAPGATLIYDVRPSDATTEPPLVLDRLADGRRRASRRSPRTSLIGRSSRTTLGTTASAAWSTTRPRRSRRRSRRTTSTASSRRSAAGRSTSSRAAAAPS